MKNVIKTFLVLCFASILLLVGCIDQGKVEKKPITGITFNDATFEYDGSPKSIYIQGELPQGVTVEYDGNGKTEPGIYTVTAKFTVTSEYVPLDDMEATLTITEDTTITIGGITNGSTYYSKVSPTFDKGTATLKHNDGEAIAFLSGTEVSELGDYVLTVVYKDNTKTVNFTIAEYYEVYEGQITDLFNNTIPNASYITDSGIDISIKDGMFVLKNKAGGDPWGITKREFNNVNATLYPYLEIDVDRVFDGAGVRLEVALTDQEWSTDPTQLVITYAGKYYLNVLDYVNAKGMNPEDATIFLKLAIVGGSAGYAGVEINSYKSLEALPTNLKADQYIDEDIETLATWRSDTARLEIIDGEAVGYVVNTVEPYGKFIKRVELNTVDYQQLVIDIKDVQGAATWSFKYSVLGSNAEITLFESNGKGVFYVDLSKVPALKDQESISVLFAFYVIGNGDNDYVTINGFRTQYLEPVLDPLIIEDFKVDNWNVQLGDKQFEQGSFTLIKKENEGMAKASKTLNLNTLGFTHVIFDVNTNFVLDDGFAIQIINQGLDGWPLYMYRGASYVLSQIEKEDGTYDYQIVLDLTLQQAFMNHESVNLFFEIVIEFGDAVKSATFTSIKYYEPGVEQDPLLIDGFKSDDWNLGLGSKEVSEAGFTLTKNLNEGMAKANKFYTLNTVQYQYVLFTFTSNFQVDPGFNIVVINQALPGWPRFDYKGANYVKSVVDNGDGTFTYEFLLDLSFVDEFMNQEVINLFFEIVIEFGDAVKYATFHSMTYFEPEVLPDPQLIDDFSADDWSLALGSIEIVENGMTLTKNLNEGAAKASKFYNLNTVVNQYVLFTFTSNFQVDPGFFIQVIDQGSAGWPSFQYKGADHIKSVIDNGNGTYTYEYLLDLSAQEAFMNHASINLFFEVVIEFGDPIKSVTFHTMKYFVPGVEVVLVEDFSVDNWTLDVGSKDFTPGNYTLIKGADQDMAKANKFLVLNTKDYNAVTISFTSNFQVDPGFRVVVIDQGSAGWPRYDYVGADHVSNVIDNGDGTYSYEFTLDLTLQEAFINHKAINLFFELVIEYGDVVKNATFHSIRYVNA